MSTSKTSASEITEKQYLIIGGTTKAATTSLYYYLGDHPDVCASSMKETRFFLDEAYPLPPRQAERPAIASNTFKALYFPETAEPYLLEATPDYLYSVGTPQRIKETLPNVKVIFLLRDPITRIVSWYKYAKQRADIPKTLSFEEYIEKQLNHDYREDAQREWVEHAKTARSEGEVPSITPYAYFLCALRHGCYSSYLRRYIDTLGSERIKVFFYEDLVADPQRLLTEVCDFLSLPADSYSDYNFKVFNRSRAMKNAKLNRAYSRLRLAVRKRTHNLFIHKGLKQLRIWTDPLYYRLNSQKTSKVEVSTEIRKKLEAHYRDDIKELEALLGRSLPWSVYSNTKVSL